ncbi:MAG: substrate-binding domain-containing protein, partial [Lachnospiraceae bacterium]|nr:substrate-binding domain-containing protein [Lachnospiraceae bacterium]
QKRKYSLVLHQVDFDEDEVDVALELIKEKRLKGIIFLGGDFRHLENKIQKLTVPYILSTVGCEPMRINEKGYSSISVDDELEMMRAVEYLIQNGHRKIAFISAGEDNGSSGHYRLEGYRKALEKHDIPYDEELIFPMKKEIESYSMENGYAIAEDMLKCEKEFTAICAISDTLAIGAMRALYDAGKRVPEDYSVIGFDGIELGKYMIPSLSTIQQPIYEIATETTKLLFDIISGKKEHEHKVLAGDLIIRESTKEIK